MMTAKSRWFGPCSAARSPTSSASRNKWLTASTSSREKSAPTTWGMSALEFTRHQLDELGIGSEVTQLTKNAAGKRVILPPSRHAPDEIIEPKRNTEGGVVDYPAFSCASIPKKSDPRTREARLLNGRSKPEGAKPAPSSSEGKNAHSRRRAPRVKRQTQLAGTDQQPPPDHQRLSPTTCRPYSPADLRLWIGQSFCQFTNPSA